METDEIPFETPLAQESAERETEEAAVDTDELYAILNLSREATADEITRRYKQLAALLHPDRHTNPELKTAADGRFQALNRAYEVLSDPKSRVIYDALGEAGLRTSWEVGNKYRTPAELRAEFERLGRKQLETDVENLVKSRGEPPRPLQ